MEHGPISFPDWKQALARAGLEPVRRGAFEREILNFLRHCKVNHAAATVELVRQYLTVHEKPSTGPARETLRWFFWTAWGSLYAARREGDQRQAARQEEKGIEGAAAQSED